MPVVLDNVDFWPWLNGVTGVEILRPAAEDRLSHVAGVQAGQ
jgi:hypothetical protein